MAKMPVAFIGHGSPMSAIEDNEYTRNWVKIASIIPKPKAILAVSAHWFTNGTRISTSSKPRMIYDMYGFPQELYDVKYAATGSPELAVKVIKLLGETVIEDNSWGIDHGTWSILKHMYPAADIPVVQLSVDGNASAEVHYEIGQKLNSLREDGILIFASGNVVHNLGRVNWGMKGGYDWADEFDNYIKDGILNRDYTNVINYKNAGITAANSFSTPEHFLPLLYALGASSEEDHLTVFNDSRLMGALSMTSYIFQ